MARRYESGIYSFLARSLLLSFSPCVYCLFHFLRVRHSLPHLSLSLSLTFSPAFSSGLIEKGSRGTAETWPSKSRNIPPGIWDNNSKNIAALFLRRPLGNEQLISSPFPSRILFPSIFFSSSLDFRPPFSHLLIPP